ncbi:hypothetical protein COCVIDRAFT_114909, partial [Bipolaris victoriae FI3]
PPPPPAYTSIFSDSPNRISDPRVRIIFFNNPPPLPLIHLSGHFPHFPCVTMKSKQSSAEPESGAGVWWGEGGIVKDTRHIRGPPGF